MTEKIRKNPTAVVLFDEIEKAHPKVLNILLQVLEDGVLTDSRGKKSFFRNNIIILTTNAGDSSHSGGIGFSSVKNKDEKVRNILSQYINGEIINRIDNIISFNQLDKKSMESITERELLFVKNRLLNMVNFIYTDKAVKYIADKSSKTEKGARGVRKIIQDDIENKIATYISEGKKVKSIKADTKNKKLYFEVV